MTSPRTLDFPLPPRRGSVPTDIRSPTLASFVPPPNTSQQQQQQQQQQQLARILELTNRYRTQTVTLLARQEALSTEQKQVFELERQLWVTERQIWEEERRLLAPGFTGGNVVAATPAVAVAVNGDKGLDSSASVQSAPLNNPTRFLSVSSMAESLAAAETAAGAMLPPPVPASLPEPVASVRKRDSTGLRMNWYLKHGMSHGADSSSMPNESVSPKGTRNGKLDSPRYAPSNDLGKISRTISEADGEGEEDFEIPSSLIAEATKLIYGDRPSKRGSFSSNSTATKRPVPALFKTLASDNQDVKSVRRASSSIYPSSKTAKYLTAFSDDGLSDEEPDPYEASRRSQKHRKRSASQTDKPNQEADIPLKLRPSSNFAAAFGSVGARGGTQNQQQQQNLAPPPPPRQGSVSISFYHPETPVDSFNSPNSFKEANWSGQPASSVPRLPENSVGGDSLQSSRTVKPTVEPINVKSAPWGVTSTNITSSPTFGNTAGNGLKTSPGGLTSSFSIGSNQNSPVTRHPILTTAALGAKESDKFSTASSRYSQDEDGVINEGHVHHDSYQSHRNHKIANKQTGSSNGNEKKTSPPTYIWTPPPPLPTSQLPISPTTSPMGTGLYGNTILLSPSTIAPSMKTSNPRLSAVGGVMPRSPTSSSPPMGRMGTSSMLLSVSSRSEGGDDLDDDVEEGDMGDIEIDTDDEDDGDVVEITNVGRATGRVKSPEMVLGGRIKSPEPRLGGPNAGNIHTVVKKAQRMDYSGPPVEIVRDNSRWGNVLPGGMI
ncbi:hypothetical protein TWF970_005139 [Orbilia oligospora]|uniref:Uncharacterized protein n=1 Tax=Orbilia oligospora TaxID=2813651 RepID=A0A7C8VCZ5_ORBOL|nr:hypothetical protein TWF970_005139 [Orbilia oligospora]